MNVRPFSGDAGTIGGRAFDRAFFFGIALVAVLAGAFALAAPSAVVPLFCAFLLFVDGPHLVATWARTYLDADFRARRGALLAGSVLWFLPGLVAWAACRFGPSRGPMDLFLLFAALWSFHHAVRQLHGVLAIYHHHGRTSLLARAWDRRFLHASSWFAFGLFSIGHPYNRKSFGLLDDPPRAFTLLGASLLALLVLSYAGYGVFRRARFSGEDSRPLSFLLGPALGVQLFAFFVVGTFEPLVPRPLDSEQAFLASQLVGGVVHGVNYLGIIAAVGKRRFSERAEPSIASFLGKRPLAAYGVFVLVSLAYLALNAARNALPGVSVFPPGSARSDFFLVFYWGLFFHHFYLDQKIWHVGSDGQLRRELGLEVSA